MDQHHDAWNDPWMKINGGFLDLEKTISSDDRGVLSSRGLQYMISAVRLFAKVICSVLVIRFGLSVGGGGGVDELLAVAEILGTLASSR